MNLFKSLFSFSKKEIAEVFKRTKLIYQNQSIKILKCNETLEHGKILIITPRTSGKAHDRNLFRRRVKAIFYEEKLYENKYNFVIIAYKNLPELDFETLKTTLMGSINKK
jgi:ribonuclease P protein component